MKKCVLSVLLCFLFTSAISANSAMTYWQGYPGSEVLLLAEENTIQVLEEQLRFDFRQPEQTGLVTASYTMKNQSDVSQSVQMLFPFVESLDKLDSELLSISENGAPISYQLYFDSSSYRETEGATQGFDADMVKSLTTQEKLLEGLEWPQKCYLYEYSLSEDTNQETRYLTLSFQLSTNQSWVISENTQFYAQKEDGTVELGGQLDQQSVLRLLVFGEDPQQTVTVYTDHTRETESNQEPLLHKDMVDGASWLKEKLVTSLPASLFELFAPNQLENLLVTELSERLSTQKVMELYDLLSYCKQQKRLMGMMYTIAFAPQEQKQVMVNYPIFGTYDARETATPIYRYDYFLSPARYWQSFANLTIDIYPSDDAPYLLDSNLSFQKVEEKHYQAHYETLPEEELTFRLYAQEQITVQDQLEKKLSGWRYFFAFTYPFWIVLTIVVIAIWLYRRKKRHN